MHLTVQRGECISRLAKAPVLPMGREARGLGWAIMMIVQPEHSLPEALQESHGKQEGQQQAWTSKLQHHTWVTSGVINPSEACGYGFGITSVLFHSRATPNRLGP